MSLQVWGDFGIVGPSNTTASPFQDRQVCINYYPEISPSRGSKVASSLLTCPGLVQIAAAPGGGAPGFSPTANAWPQPSAVKNLPVRGMWVLPGRVTALVVISNVCYLARVITMGSRTVAGSFSLAKVGELKTYSGQVCIRDNGVAGTAVIVDGPNGYFYAYANASDIGPPGTFLQITDPAFLGADRVAFIDGWWIFNRPGTQTFYTNAPQYSTKFQGSYFALKDAFTDRLMGVIENKEQLWLPGETTTEIWYDAGGQYFPFQRLIGTELQVGCMATQSIARLSSGGQDSLIWLGRAERGENVVVRTQGLNYEVVTTPAVSDAIASYPYTADAIGYVYQEDTHEFYQLTFPTADRTWVYDASMPLELAWHERLSYDPYAAQFHRHRSNCYMNFAGMRIVGDYQNGALYQLTRAVQNEAGWPLYRRRRSPYLWNKEDRERAHMQSLQVEFSQGQGSQTGLGANPQAYLTVARDNGMSLASAYEPSPSNTFPAPLASVGNTKQRTIWRKLGWANWATMQLDVIAPVNSDIMGATIKAFGQ
jgi:hypothetical protein